MNKSILLFLLAAGVSAVLGWTSAQATELYTWTDQNGVVHYVDTPPDNPNAVPIDAPEAYRPGTADAYPQDNSAEQTDGSEPAAATAPTENGAQNDGVSDEEGAQDGGVSYADQKRKQMAEKRETRHKEQAERDQNCARAREQLAILEPSRRVFFTNDQGETERMDDVQRVRKVEEAKAQIAKYCK